ncbi:MAG: hypothetical protein ACLFQK_06190 [Fibrobacterota bacterium]
MKETPSDIKKIYKWSPEMRGVFSLNDLRSIIKVFDSTILYRRIRSLEENGIIIRYIRRFYVTENFDMKTLAARIYGANSYVSLGSVLSEKLITGVLPAKNLYMVKTGKGRSFTNERGSLTFSGIKKELFFGYKKEKFWNEALPEKAFLDTLYFYQKGMRFPFDIYSDINISLINKGLVLKWLDKYRNPRFRGFVRKILNG